MMQQQKQYAGLRGGPMMEKDSDEEDYMEIQRQMKMGSQNIGGP